MHQSALWARGRRSIQQPRHFHGSSWRCTLPGVVNDLVRDRLQFNDYKGEFNYTLSLTSSGYDGTIIHVIYQQDTCIHNKLKAKCEISVAAKNIKKKRGSGVEYSRAPLPPKSRTNSPAATQPRGFHPRNSLPQQPANPKPPVVCQQCSLTKGREGKAGLRKSPPFLTSSELTNQGPQGC